MYIKKYFLTLNCIFAVMFELVKSYTVPLNSLEEIKKAFPTDESCIAYLEQVRWNSIPQSPFSSTSKVYTCGNGKYRCKSTHKYFTVKTYTVLDGTKVTLPYWFITIIMYLNYDKDFELTIQYLRTQLNVTPRTVWLLLNKVRYATKHTCYKQYMHNLKVYPHLEYVLRGLMRVPRSKGT